MTDRRREAKVPKPVMETRWPRSGPMAMIPPGRAGNRKGPPSPRRPPGMRSREGRWDGGI